MFGLVFWLNPPTAKSSIAGAFPEIAWAVKEMAKAEQANMAVVMDVAHWWVDKDGYVSTLDLSFTAERAEDAEADASEDYVMAAFDVTLTRLAV